MKLKPKRIKIFLLALLLADLFFSVVDLAYAQQGNYVNYKGENVPYEQTVQSGIEKYLCAPTMYDNSTVATPQTGVGLMNQSGNNLYLCINRIYRFVIVLGTIAGVMMIVVAGYIYMSSDGNQEAVDKAKSMFVSTITAMVILFSGYLLLKTLNPDLIAFRTIQAPGAPMPSAVTPKVTAPAGASAAFAQTILGMNNKITVNSTRCDCAGNCPSKTLQDLAAGKKAIYDGPGNACNVNSTDVSAKMLTALITAAGAGNSFIIESITSGHHSTSNDPHYQGNAVDVIPQPANATAQAQLVSSLRQSGANKIGLECDNRYISLTGGNDASTECIGKPGYHIHAQWQ